MSRTITQYTITCNTDGCKFFAELDPRKGGVEEQLVKWGWTIQIAEDGGPPQHKCPLCSPRKPVVSTKTEAELEKGA